MSCLILLSPRQFMKHGVAFGAVLRCTYHFIDSFRCENAGLLFCFSSCFLRALLERFCAGLGRKLYLMKIVFRGFGKYSCVMEMRFVLFSTKYCAGFSAVRCATRS